MFIISSMSIATDKNPSFEAGTRHEYFIGKGEKLFTSEEFYRLKDHWLNEYGFKTKAAGMKALKSQQKIDDSQNSWGFWISKSELVER